jgi:CRP-like cAMP-binding protein
VGPLFVKTRNGKAAAKVRLFGNSDAVLGVASIYQPNEEIYGEGEPAKRLYQVLRGVVRTQKLLNDGRRSNVFAATMP